MSYTRLMKKLKEHKIKFYMLMVLAVMLFLVGCGNVGSDGGGNNTEDTQDLLAGTRGLFLILEHNTTAKTITLYSYETEETHYYVYDFSTKFYDKYGQNEPKERFTVGRVIELDAKTGAGYLTGLHISDEVWEQKDIVRFSMNLDKGIFTIGDVNYSIKDKVMVFSNGKEIALSDLWEEDVITVVGQGNKVLSVDVVKGHGILKLTNTKLFDGSVFNLGEQIYDKVSEGITLKVPEGVYPLTVAKDGWGSTTEITITRGEVTEIDLDTVKGEGPKKGKVSFQINVEDVQVYIDYKLIDHTQPVELVYGTHVLEISAPGYSSWKKKLVVGAQEATIIVELEVESNKPEDSTQDTEKDDGKKDSEKESEKESGKDKK